MTRLAPATKLAFFLVLAVLLGYVVERSPERLTLSLPDQGVTVSVPENLEGWVLEPGEGDVLVKGHTRGGLVSLEVAKVPVAQNGDIYGYIQERHQELKQGKREYIVWHQGSDSKFGLRNAPTYKATHQGRVLGLWTTEVWEYDSYWPYRGQYARITMRYPDFLVNYVYPDKALIGTALKLEP